MSNNRMIWYKHSRLLSSLLFLLGIAQVTSSSLSYAESSLLSSSPLTPFHNKFLDTINDFHDAIGRHNKLLTSVQKQRNRALQWDESACGVSMMDLLGCAMQASEMLVAEDDSLFHVFCNETDENSCLSNITRSIEFAIQDGSESCMMQMEEMEGLRAFCMRADGEYCYAFMMGDGGMPVSPDYFCHPCAGMMMTIGMEAQETHEDAAAAAETQAMLTAQCETVDDDGNNCMDFMMGDMMTGLANATGGMPSADQMCNPCYISMMQLGMEAGGGETEEELDVVDYITAMCNVVDENGRRCLDVIGQMADHFDNDEEVNFADICFMGDDVIDADSSLPDQCSEECQAILREVTDAVGCCAESMYTTDFMLNDTLIDFVEITCGIEVPPPCAGQSYASDEEDDPNRAVVAKASQVVAANGYYTLSIAKAIFGAINQQTANNNQERRRRARR